MSVLVEAISVVVRRDSVARQFPGGWRDSVDLVVSVYSSHQIASRNTSRRSWLRLKRWDDLRRRRAAGWPDCPSSCGPAARR